MASDDKESIKLTFEDAFDLWLKSVADPENAGHDIFIFSPFITGDLILKLFEEAKYGDAYLITNVKAQSVLAGSLDLAILKQLLQNDVKVFHLENLHSKILFYCHDLVIGSQNFTRGGRKNEEATVGITVTNEIFDEIIDYVTNQRKSPSKQNDLDGLSASRAAASRIPKSANSFEAI